MTLDLESCRILSCIFWPYRRHHNGKEITFTVYTGKTFMTSCDVRMVIAYSKALKTFINCIHILKTICLHVYCCQSQTRIKEEGNALLWHSVVNQKLSDWTFSFTRPTPESRYFNLMMMTMTTTLLLLMMMMTATTTTTMMMMIIAIEIAITDCFTSHELS